MGLNSLYLRISIALITGNLKDYPEEIRQGTVVIESVEYLNWIKKV